MTDDSLADPSALAPALPGPATTTPATLDAEALLAPGEIAAAVRFAEAAKAAHNRRAYADWADCRWIATRGVNPQPCPPGLLCGYLAALAEAASGHPPRPGGPRRSRIGTGAAGLDPPTANPAVREVLRGIRHTGGTAPQSKTPPLPILSRRLLAVCLEMPRARPAQHALSLHWRIGGPTRTLSL